jgi:hypothetical protein
MSADKITARLYPPDYEHVPTVPELARQGLAREQVAKRIDKAGQTKSDTRYVVSPKGQQLIVDAMQRNADRSRAWDARRMNAAVDADLI